ncbi:MAG: acyl-CoA dehydrogenase family protein, partial [Balneolaceae bacterium]
MIFLMEHIEQLVPPLTQLTEDEQMLKEAASDFAEASIKPLVAEMDEKAKLDPDLIRQFFEMGLMGIDIPEKYAGGGGTFMMSIVAIEQISRVDASAGVFMDVQNTLVNNAFVNFASDFLKEKYLPLL